MPDFATVLPMSRPIRVADERRAMRLGGKPPSVPLRRKGGFQDRALASGMAQIGALCRPAASGPLADYLLFGRKCGKRTLSTQPVAMAVYGKSSN